MKDNFNGHAIVLENDKTNFYTRRNSGSDWEVYARYNRLETNGQFEFEKRVLQKMVSMILMIFV